MSKVVWLTSLIVLALAIREGVAQQPRATSHEIVQLRSDQTLFNPNSKKALSYRDGQLVIGLVNGEKNLAVDIKSASGPGGRVELPAEIVQVNEMRAAQGGKAVVVGMVNGSVYEIVILNTRAPGIADMFLAYSPALSPDARFIAFVKFYPAHFVEGTDDRYLLYDVSRSAVDNRPSNATLNDHTNVGIAVYPHTANQGGDNTGVPPQQQHHMLAQRFFWQSDSSRYVFADDYAGEWDLVLVAIADGVPSATKITVPQNEACALLRKESCQVTLAEAEPTPSGLVASFQGVAADSALCLVIEYGYQQFSPVR